jgi:tetratricopeptide (TPR) repeat protein
MDRAPQGPELERLARAFRDNPKSAIFVPLALGYLAASRARDAMDVLTQGLEAYPDHTEGRLTLAKAHAALSQWKEAEQELVKVVKLDRYHQRAFSLLGEVLIRRTNYDVALKALQRAVDLDPTDDHAQMLLTRAKERRPLDAPAPAAATVKPKARPEFDDAATVIREPDFRGDHTEQEVTNHTAPTGAPAVGEFAQDPTTTQMPAPAEMRLRAEAAAADVAPIAPPRPSRQGPAVPTPPAVMRSEPVRPEPMRAEPVRPDPVRPEPVRPAPIPAPAPTPVATRQARPAPRRPNGAAPAPMADAGPVELPTLRDARADRPEEFLNALLGSGQAVDEIPDVIEDGVPAKRWGRGHARIFLWLWSGLGIATIAMAAYILLWFRARDAAVERHLDTARAKMFIGGATDFVLAEHEATAAVKRHPGNGPALATRAAARALAYYVYGTGEQPDIDTAIIASKRVLAPEDPKAEKVPPDAPGRRELAIAQMSFALARADRGLDRIEMNKLRPVLDEALRIWPNDQTLRWLDGMHHWANGDPAGARTAFQQADASGAGPPIARISLGDLDLDEGNSAAATAAYDAALSRVPGHPMAIAGRALATAEKPGGTQAQWQQALTEVAPASADVPGKRAEGWTRLAVASLYVRLGHKEQALTELEGAKQTGVAEARFLWRIALLQLAQGHYEDAYTSRQRITRRGAEPVLGLIDGELLLAAGRPDDALAALADVKGARAGIARARALLDTGKPSEAQQQLTAVLTVAADDPVAKGWSEVAKVAADPGSSSAALSALEKRVKDASPGANVLYGEALLARGDTSGARKAFEAAILEESPLQYRAHARLGQLALAAGKPADAEKSARAALAQSPGHIPSHSVLGRSLLAQNKLEEAAPELQLIQNTARATAEDELAFAAGLAATGQADAAKEALKRARDKGASEEAIKKVELSLADDGGGAAPAPAPKAPPKPRRRGR